MSYTLTRTRSGEDDVTQTLAEWGIENPKLHFLQQSADTFTFTIKGNAFGASTFADGDKLSLSSGGVQFFVGEIEMIPRSANESTREMSFTAYGPWRKLEQRIFCQQWAKPNPSFDNGQPDSSTNPFLKQYDTTHVFLGANIEQIYPVSGEPVPTETYLNTGEQIQEVLDYLERCETYPGDTAKIGDFLPDYTALPQNLTLRSQQCALGNLNVSVAIPIQEDRDITCAQAIQKMLRWSPDAVAFYDYSTTPPTFRVRRSSGNTGLEPVTLRLHDQVVLGCDLAPRYDLQRPSVCIIYEQKQTIGGITYDDNYTDVYPVGSTGREARALVSTVALTGGEISVTSSTIVTEAIEADVANGTAPGGSVIDRTVLNPGWWLGYYPHLARAQGYNLRIVFRDRVLTNSIKVVDYGLATEAVIPGNVAATSSTPAVDAGGIVTPVPSTLPYRLVSGNLAPWMKTDAGDPVEYEDATVRARASYQLPSVVPVDPTNENLNPKIEEELLAVNIRACNLPSGTYTNREILTYPEQRPVALAGYLFESLSVLHYSGTVQLTTQAGQHYILTHGGDHKTWLGKELNITGGAVEWNNMAAVIQGFTVDLTDGSTSLTVGPPEHLGPADLIQLLRENRARNINFMRSPDGRSTSGGVEIPPFTTKAEPTNSDRQLSALTLHPTPPPATDATYTAPTNKFVVQTQPMDATTNPSGPRIIFAVPGFRVWFNGTGKWLQIDDGTDTGRRIRFEPARLTMPTDLMQIGPVAPCDSASLATKAADSIYTEPR